MEKDTAETGLLLRTLILPDHQPTFPAREAAERDPMDQLTDGTASRVILNLESTLSSVETVEQTAFDFARRAGFDEELGLNIAMVVREAAINAVVHGNKYDPLKSVRASFELTPEQLSITIADQGEGCDPDTIPDPLAPENLMHCSGRGVFLMRAFMDEVHFRQLTPGTEITLVKRRTS